MHLHSPVKQLQRPQAAVPKPGLHLDVVEQLCSRREEVAKDWPEGGAGCLAAEPSYPSIDPTLRRISRVTGKELSKIQSLWG